MARKTAPSCPAKEPKKKLRYLFFVAIIMFSLAAIVTRLHPVDTKQDSGYVKLAATGIVLFAVFILFLTVRFLLRVRKENRPSLDEDKDK